MSTMQVNGNTYTEDDLAGKKYKNTFPDLCRDVYQSLFLTQVALCKQVFTLSLGVFTFTVESNKAFYISMKFAAFQALPTSSDYSGYISNPPVFCGTVISYDKGTGSLKVKIDHLFTHGTLSTLYFATTITSTKPVSNTLANKLTSTNGIDLSNQIRRRGTFGISSIRNGLGVMADPVNFPPLPPPYYASLSGTGTVSNYYKDVYAPTTINPSSISLLCGTGRAAIYLGRKPWIKYNAYLWGTFRFRSAAALSDGTNNYKITLGFRGHGSTEAAPLGHSGMGVTYNHAENSGNWVARTGNNGTTYSSNSAIAFAINTEYEIKVRVESNQVKFYVNGSSIGPLTAPTTANVNNFLHPFIMIERTAGTINVVHAHEISIGGF